MKRALRIICLSLVVVIISLVSSSIQLSASSNGYNWVSGDSVKAFTPSSGGVWYPRLLKLNNGDWLLSFDTNEGGGYAKVKVMRSTDGGRTWGSKVTVAQDSAGDCANGQMLQLKNGDIWLAYRVVINSGGNYYSYLRVKVSTNNGATWSDLPNGQIAAEVCNSYRGVWEPHLGYIGNTIAVMYANDGPSVTSRFDQQNIYMKTWTGNGWSSPILVCDGVAANSREGMPVWCQMSNGSYIVVFESTDKPGYPFVIKYKISPDGYNWSGPRYELYTPSQTGRKAGAPFVVRRGDNKLMVSFQTDEDTKNAGDSYSVFKAVLGNSDATGWSYPFTVWPVDDNSNSNWNALMAVDNNQVVAATSTNYPSMGVWLRWSTTVTPYLKNLVNNWSFETANKSGWTTYGDDYPNRIIVHGINDGLARCPGGGNYFIGLASPSGGTGTAYIGQTISGLDNGIYTMRAYLRSSGGQPQCYMEVKDYGGAMRTVNFPVTTQWTPVEIGNINVTNNQATIGFYTRVSSTSQWADIDNVEFFRNLTDDFNDGNDNGWTKYGGTWTVENGQYCISNNGSGKSLAGDFSWSNYTVEADIRPVDTPNSGIVFRVTNPSSGADAMNGYFAGLGDNVVVLGKMNGTWNPITVTNFTVNRDTWYHMKVVVNGQNIKVYVNDTATPVIDVNDSSYSYGAAGVRAHYCKTYFDNFVVR